MPNSFCGCRGDLGLGRDSCSLAAAAAALVDDAEGGVEKRAPSIRCSSRPAHADAASTSTAGARDDRGSPGPAPLGQLVPRGIPGPGVAAAGQLLLTPPLMVVPDAMLGQRNVACGLQTRKLLFLADLSGTPWMTVPSARGVIWSPEARYTAAVRGAAS